MDDTDLAGRIDAGIGRAPADHVDLAALIGAGRRRRRRHRAAIGAGAAAGAVAVAALVVGILPALQATGTDRDTATTVRTQVVRGPDNQLCDDGPTRPTGTQKNLVTRSDVVAYDARGRLVVAGNCTITQREDNPLGLAAPGRSEAVELLIGSSRYRFISYWSNGVSGRSGSFAAPRQTFTQWVESSPMASGADTQVAPAVWPDAWQIGIVLLGFRTGTDELVPRVADGTQILDQRGGVSVGRAWADPGTTTAAALVQRHGKRFYLLVRQPRGQSVQIVTVPQRGNGKDLDAFIALARQQYASAP